MVRLGLKGHEGSGTAQLLIVRGDFHDCAFHLSQPFDGSMPGHIAFVVSTTGRLSDDVHDFQLEGIVHLKPLVAIEKSSYVFEDDLRPSHVVVPFYSRGSAVRVGVRETLGRHVNVNAIPVVNGIGIE